MNRNNNPKGGPSSSRNANFNGNPSSTTTLSNNSSNPASMRSTSKSLTQPSTSSGRSSCSSGRKEVMAGTIRSTRDTQRRDHFTDANNRISAATTTLNLESINANNDHSIRTNASDSLMNPQDMRKVQTGDTNPDGEVDEHESRPTELINMKNFFEQVEEPENREMRPNKLFPVKNERDIILRKVRSVLNKVSSINYHRLRKRWLNLMPNGEEEYNGSRLTMDQIGEVLQLVIAKAMDDTIYMHIYAGLMGYVVARISPEVSSKVRQLVNYHLHHELQKLATDKELALFAHCTERVDSTRRKKVTLHRFISELYGEKGCTSKFLYERVKDLLIASNPSDVDENIECLCVLMTFAGQKLEQVKKKWVEEIFHKLVHRQNETPQMVSKRIQFMILDLIEMRGNGWSPHSKSTQL